MNNKTSIYDILDPLSDVGQAPDDEETALAIKSMMIDQKRDVNKRSFPELTPASPASPEPIRTVEPDGVFSRMIARLKTRCQTSHMVRRYSGHLLAFAWLAALFITISAPELAISLVAVAVMAVLAVRTRSLFRKLIGLAGRDPERARGAP